MPKSHFYVNCHKTGNCYKKVRLNEIISVEEAVIGKIVFSEICNFL